MQGAIKRGGFEEISLSVRLVRTFASFMIASLLTGCGGTTYTAAVLKRPPAAGAPAGPASASIPGTVPQSGSVRLPSGVALDPKSLVAQNSLGAVSVDGSGGFQLRAFGDGQLAVVSGSAGKPLLLGFLDAKRNVLSVHTTAQVLVYYGAYFFMLPAAQEQVVFDSLDTLPGLNSIEAALSAALVAHPTASAIADPDVVLAVNRLVRALVKSSGIVLPATVASATTSQGRKSLLISPAADGRSGITPILDSFPDGVHFQNRYRRSASAFVDQVSHVGRDDVSVPGTQITDGPPDRSAPQSISSVSGFNGVLGTINDIVAAYFANTGSNGDSSATAYTPINTDSTPLANVATAKSTRYRVAVVGPGRNAGDEAQLTSVERQAQVDTSTTFMINEVLVPFASSVALGRNALKGGGKVGDALKDLLPLYGSIPGFNAAAQAGDVKEIFRLGLLALASAGSIQDKTFDAILRYVGSAATGNVAAATAALAFSRVLTGGDLVLGAIDAAAVGADLLRSNRADVYFVDVTGTKISLTPASSIIAPLATVTLKTNTPDAQAASGSLVYHYTNTAINGHLIRPDQQRDDDFDSSMPTVTYVAGATGSDTNDTVTVTAKVIDGQKRTDIGTASATVAVAKASPSPAPISSLPGGYSGTFTGNSGGTLVKDVRMGLYGSNTPPSPYANTQGLVDYQFRVYTGVNSSNGFVRGSLYACVTTVFVGGGATVACPPTGTLTGGAPAGNATFEYSPDYKIVRGNFNNVQGLLGTFVLDRDDSVRVGDL
jgi:hypothetical protein